MIEASLSPCSRLWRALRIDSPSVPRYLVEYVVYHEMLHIKFPVERRGQRRIVHSREFRDAEKKFPQYEAACRKLKNLCG